MFIVYDPQGLTKPYTQGIRPRTQGLVSAVSGVSSVASGSVHKIPPHPKQNNPYHQLDEPESPRILVYASDIMSSPVEAQSAEMLVRDIVPLFQTRRFRHFPIVNSEQRLVGIVSDRDVFYRHSVIKELKLENQMVKDIMATPVLSAAPQTEIRDLAKVMFEEHIGAIPIVDHNSMLQGMVTRSDILRGLLKHGPIALWG